MDKGFIKPADIKVVPYFVTNDDLASSISSILNSHLKKKENVIENQRSQRPTFLVFRPTGRAGDEFEGIVTPHLKEDSPKYLIIAFTTNPTDSFGISEDDQKRLYCHQTRVVINEGRLVVPPENNHKYNSDSLKKLAEAICKDYDDFVEMRPISRILSVCAVLLACWNFIALSIFPLLVFNVSLALTFVVMILSTLKKCLEHMCMFLVNCIRNTSYACGFSDDYINVGHRLRMK